MTQLPLSASDKQTLLGNRVMLAPLAGISDAAFRVLCRQFGAGPLFTEMVSAHAVAIGRTRLLDEQLPLLEHEHPLAVQFVGNVPDFMEKCSRMAQDAGVDSINLNMACPAPKVTKSGKGASMMNDLPLAKEVILAAVNAVDLPVTVKIRAGWDGTSRNAVAFAQMAQEAGAKMVIVHPRTRRQAYSGLADWSLIADVKRSVDVPVVGNGDIKQPEDALRMVRETNCDGVMIGRGSYGRPWLFLEILRLFEREGIFHGAPFAGSTGKMPATASSTFLPELADGPFVESLIDNEPTSIGAVIRLHLSLLLRHKEEAQVAKEIRKHLAWYSKGLPGAAKLRKDLSKMKDMKTVEAFGVGFFETPASASKLIG